MVDPLPDDLARAIAASTGALGPFANLHYRIEVSSTNDVAMALAAEGAPEGTSVLAHVQRRGRGRRGHDWSSPAGAGLYLSVIARPPVEAGPLPLVTIGAGVAAAEAVFGLTGLPIELKWPNDLVIGRPWRKLGGILAEGVTVGSRLTAVAIGIGLNLRDVGPAIRMPPGTTSLEAELGRPCERADAAVALLVRLRELLQLVHAGERRAIVDRWRRFGRGGLGEPVRWSDQGGEHRGIVRDVDEQGALLVATGGRVVRVLAGSVTWEGLSRE